MTRTQAAPRFLALCLACTVSAACGGGDAVHPDRQRFEDLAQEFLPWYLSLDPVRATELGVHDWDNRLPDLSRETIAITVDAWRGWLIRLEEIPREHLRGDAYFDHRVLEYGIRAALLELEEVAAWRRNPNHYNSLAARGVATLIDREFAPLDVRVAALRGRLGQLPSLLAAARDNLHDVPPVWVDLALRNVAGTASFLQNDVPDSLALQGLERLPDDTVVGLQEDLGRAVEEVRRFETWLRDELRPRAHGEFRLGPDLFRRKLLYEEHFDIDLEALRRMNEEAIADYRAWVEREAERVDPDAEAADVMARITGRYPASDELIETASGYVEQAREFIRSRELVTLPSDDLPVIRPTPEFARSGFASMSTPGPFESNATIAYYNITLVDPEWSERQQAEHLTYFNYPGLLGVSIHEVMPGHFVQLLYRQQVPTDLRKVFMPSSLIEGWAHYTEQMMIDEGFGDAIPGARLGQLRRALQRHARWHVGMAMHVSGESILDAADQFADIAYFARFPALRETQRGTYNPTFLYYALGRMEILRLREDYRAYLESRGETFSIREFHDTVLRMGLPIPLIRAVLIPEDGYQASRSHPGSGSIPSPSANRS
ncbi:MAG: DUF885 family protein [Acidobacteria bacterium]|nr:DUF885 family protein [Acidobacteriota bacterium]NIM61371.1 DUF885 family protein [Acidobacteriota bacterium]NIO58806.1 DUF885 family protein [Acidobacteriota bacterium]NIQ29850.1 DUF885 family protein [Acidobacteriota bacterium]NIQ84583.1 DUF885 family protein [Acidobacteriota bacterium]